MQNETWIKVERAVIEKYLQYRKYKVQTNLKLSLINSDCLTSKQD